MMDGWARSGELSVDADGQVYHWQGRSWRWLGALADVIAPPAGSEGDLVVLSELWRQRYDPRAECDAAYYAAKTPVRAW